MRGRRFRIGERGEGIFLARRCLKVHRGHVGVAATIHSHDYRDRDCVKRRRRDGDENAQGQGWNFVDGHTRRI